MGTKESKAIALWLFVLAGLVFAMTVLGGVTRLTGSGLSMVQWEPIMGWLPPLGSEQWEAAFALYRNTPEFKELNSHMNLAGFQGIFWLEYFHRLLGRSLGVFFLVPFLYFLGRGWLSRAYLPRLVGLFLLGGGQGVMGWYMVKSGLVDLPHVSQYRLAAHLGLGFIIFASILWIAIDFYAPPTDHGHRPVSRPAWLATVLLIVTFITVLSGALVAGTHAGMAFNTFPLMEGRWFPANYGELQPLWRNLFENIAAIQWDHRWLATLTFGGIVGFWFWYGRHAPHRSMRVAAMLLLGMGMMQVAMGIATLLWLVPIYLASAHQAGALVLFGLILVNVRLWNRL